MKHIEDGLYVCKWPYHNMIVNSTASYTVNILFMYTCSTIQTMYIARGCSDVHVGVVMCTWV